MHLMVIGITMEMSLMVFSKDSSTLPSQLYKTKIKKLIHFRIMYVERKIGKGETSNDPQEKYRIDEVGRVIFSHPQIFSAISSECRG